MMSLSTEPPAIPVSLTSQFILCKHLDYFQYLWEKFYPHQCRSWNFYVSIIAGLNVALLYSLQWSKASVNNFAFAKMHSSTHRSMKMLIWDIIELTIWVTQSNEILQQYSKAKQIWNSTSKKLSHFFDMYIFLANIRQFLHSWMFLI